MTPATGTFTTAVSVLLVCAGAAAAAPDGQAEAEIQELLAAVGRSDCTFIRNGEPHDSANAKAHLEKKYDYARRYLKSAEQFIDKVASGSSISGKPYLVDCPDAEPEPARDWLTDRLLELRKPSPPE